MADIIVLSEETWLKIQRMLEDWENGALRVIPGDGLKIQEQPTAKIHCRGTRIAIDGTTVCPE